MSKTRVGIVTYLEDALGVLPDPYEMILLGGDYYIIDRFCNIWPGDWIIMTRGHIGFVYGEVFKSETYRRSGINNVYRIEWSTDPDVPKNIEMKWEIL